MILLIILFLFAFLHVLTAISWFPWPGKRRSQTKLQNLFALSRPSPVKFDFSDSEILISIPWNSRWYSVWGVSNWEWTDKDENCLEISVYQSQGFVVRIIGTGGSGAYVAGPGYHYRQRVMERMYFAIGSSGARTPGTIFGLKADHARYRTLCSVTQDAELYMQLRSTPVWLRLWYWSLKYTPVIGQRLRERLVNLAFKIQILAINYADGYYTDEGRIPAPGFWLFDPIPLWAQKFEINSMYIISKITRAMCYWIALLFLGMQTRYLEYTGPVENIPHLEKAKPELKIKKPQVTIGEL
ncbi:hypothetical protein TWF694_011390 [Orbilia ellipsospora]|uniref:Uncharacterized protein n=1 Tax=Orbilia ellipsospora TaxID=2528407 RepID=A0AAV9X5F3_9PEZI